jgi:hypothetical protein
MQKDDGVYIQAGEPAKKSQKITLALWDLIIVKLL